MVVGPVVLCSSVHSDVKCETIARFSLSEPLTNVEAA